MTKRKYTDLCASALGFIYLLIFASFYIITYLPSVRLLEVGDTVYYIADTLTSLIDYCLPLISAVTVFVLSGCALKKAAIYSLILALPKLLYFLPYYYLYEIAYGNDSLESLGLSFVISLGLVALTVLHILLLYLIMYFVSCALIGKGLRGELPIYEQKNVDKRKRKELWDAAKSGLSERIGERGFFDLGIPVCAGIFCAGLLDFTYLLVSECIDAGIYLVSFAGSYTIEEIGLMMLSFLFILLKLLLAYTVSVLLKNLAYKATQKTE